MRALHFGFWIDPLQRLRPGHDSSLVLMAEAVRRGHRVFCFETKDLSVERGVCRIQATAVHVQHGTERATELGRVPLSIDELDFCFLRKDPPVDVAYAHATRMLEYGAVWPSPHFVNAPQSLRELNEKLIALRYPDLTPLTLVTSDPEILSSARARMGVVIVKPLDGCGGVDVYRLHPGDDAREAWAKVTVDGSRPAIVQQYLASAIHGDKRVIIWNGEPLGAINRLAKDGEFRNNFAVGGRAEAAEVDARDREICRRLRPFLLEAGLQLVGIDVIGGMLTEVNITSPTGLCEINAADGVRLEERIIRDCERMLSERLPLEPAEERGLQH